GKDGALAGKPIDKLSLLDVVCPAKPDTFKGKVETVAADLAAPGETAKAIADLPDVIFHLAGVVSGEAELDFDKGYRVNLDGTRAAERSPKSGSRLPAPPRLSLLDRGVRRAVSPFHPRRFPSHAAHLLRHAEGDRGSAHRRLHPARLLRGGRHPPAEHRGAAGQ